MMTQEGSTKIVNLMTLGAGFFVLRSWRGGGKRERVKIMYNFDKHVSINSKLHAFILRGYKAAFLCHYLFLSILDGPVDMQI